MSPLEALNAAIAAVNGQSELARRLVGRIGPDCKVKQQHISHWLKTGVVPSEYCRHIEAETGISRYRLRPDVFGPEPPERARAVA